MQLFRYGNPASSSAREISRSFLDVGAEIDIVADIARNSGCKRWETALKHVLGSRYRSTSQGREEEDGAKIHMTSSVSPEPRKRKNASEHTTFSVNKTRRTH